MYTYKLGGISITDELYHDDLEAMTFGRKDQNELRHSGIKGMSWGKRRFQNEDGSLTAAGRNRYGVGDPMKGVSAYSDTGGRGGSGVSYTRLPAGSGGANRTVSGTGRTYGSTATSSRTPGVSQQMRSNTAKQVSSAKQRVTNRTDAGRKAADNLFGRIGNWASNAAKDVGNAATNAYNGATRAVNDAANWVGDRAQDVKEGIQNLGNTPEARNVGNALNSAKNWVGNAAKDVGNFAANTYNDASKAVTNVANNVGDAVKDVAQDVSDWYTGDKAGREAQRYDNVVRNFEQNGERNINEGVDTISKGINISNQYPNVSDRLMREGLNQRNLGYDQHDIARQYGQKADEAQARYEAAPRQVINSAAENVGNAAKDAGNWLGNAFNSAKNWVGDRANDVGDAVSDTAQGIKNWYTGEGDKRSADWYRDLSTRDTDWLGTGQNLIENHQAVADESRKIAENLRKNGDYENAKRYEQNAEAYQRAADRMASDRNRNLSNAEMYDMRYDNAPRQVLSNLPGNITNAVSGAAKDVGDWASNAASDVRDWGAGALDKGRQAFESLFGRSEPPKAEKLDPTPKTFTENVITEQMIPEQRITENRIEEQRIPENREIETRPTVSGSNNVQTWDNGNINTWDNVKTFGDPGMADIARQYMNQQNSSSSSNAQREQRRQETLSDKPDNVSNEFWEEYKANGGTRDAYERELKNRKSSAVPVSSDKDYVAEQERLRNISAQQDRNGYRVEEVNAPVGTVDTSRPYHFTYDPASGQTVVVYDDEKRR